MAPRYTNPALMDLANTILWGEVLQDERMVAAGNAKLDAWIAYTAQSGAPFEYNSPAYLVVDLTALATLANLASYPEVRLKAQRMEERLWLHVLLHFHAATGQLAGPQSRAYYPLMHGGGGGILDVLWQELGVGDEVARSPYLAPSNERGAVTAALAGYHCPAHLASWAAAQTGQYPYMVRETADRTGGMDLATYCTASYALGTASRTYSIGQGGFDIEHQANYCILYYCCADGGRQTADGRDSASWRTLYTRFVVNDGYLGSVVQPPNRRATTNFYDQGLFAGHQHRNVAIALYGLELMDREITSVEALVVLPGPVRPQALYAGRQRMDEAGLETGRPTPVSDGEWVVVEDGALWVGLWPLERDHLGKRRGLEVRVLPSGDLALAMSHYRGPGKWFWEYGSPVAAFYHRNLRSGFLLVVGEREAYPTREAFAAHLARAAITDTLDAAGVRTVTYQNTDAWLELRYDLVRSEVVERRIDGRRFAAPALGSPWAVQVAGGTATLGEATLNAGIAPAVLFARDALTAPGLAGLRVWEAMLLTDGPQPIRLETPAGTVRCDAFGFGAVRIEAPPDVDRPSAIRVRCTRADAPIRLPVTSGGAQDCTITVDGAAWVAELEEP
ncbi:MAG: hypothetical protein HY332_13890 [Chloroflexi bacterium]|nr:hypothetical protein [Chloroflexota bacterium]